MSDDVERFEWVSRAARAALVGTLTLLSLALLVAVALTVYLYATYGPQGDFFVGVVLGVLVGVLVLSAWVVACYGVVRVLLSGESGVASIAARLSNIETLLENQVGSLHKLVELAPLSNQAKSLIFREREVEAMRETLHGELMRQNYAAAEALIDEFEKRLGYGEEAARLRQEAEATRKATLEEKIDAAVRRIQGIIDRRDWARALREAQRILRLFPDNPKVASLPERIEAARAKHKRELLQEYGEAVRKNDVDRGVALLNELDRYLTPQEGAALEESARGVFKARLHQLGVQFAIRVTDQQWSEAIAAGENIIREFPNSRMAQEVREKMELLRSRAEAATQATPQPQVPVNK